MSFIDLENEDLINADENELFVEEENLLVDDGNARNVDPDFVGNDPAPSTDAVKVEPKKKVVRNPQPKLNYDRLKGPRGLLALEASFKDVKFKGKGYEKEDLDMVMTRLEQWTHRLFPKFTFDDTLEKVEQLGRKKIVSNYVNRIRLGMIDDNATFAQNDIIEDREEPTDDPFDRLTEAIPLGQSTQVDPPSTAVQQSTLTDEQRERMIRNRLLAEERRLARMKARQEEQARLQSEQNTQAQVESGTQSVEEDERNVQDFGELLNQSKNYVNRIRPGTIDDNDTNAQNDIIEDREEPTDDPFDRSTEAIPPGQSTQVDPPSTGVQQSTLTQEQRERMIRNRLLAEERRLARMKARQEEQARLQSEQNTQAQVESGTQCVEGERNVQNFGELQSEVSSQPLVPSQPVPNNWDDDRDFDSLVMDQM